jgi:hypothetical protein
VVTVGGAVVAGTDVDVRGGVAVGDDGVGTGIVVVGGTAVGLGLGPGRFMRITRTVTSSKITATMAATTATMDGHGMGRESTTFVVGGFGAS